MPLDGLNMPTPTHEEQIRRAVRADHEALGISDRQDIPTYEESADVWNDDPDEHEDVITAITELGDARAEDIHNDEWAKLVK